MKILFLVGATSRIRNFHHTIMELAEHGHTVQLTGRLRKGAFELPGGIEHARAITSATSTRGMRRRRASFAGHSRSRRRRWCCSASATPG
jgi:hypothetical protein